MGNELSSLFGKRFQVSVTTGDLKGAGTDCNVYLILYDEYGQSTSSLKLDKAFHDDLERGKTDEYTGPRCDTDFGTVSEIEIWRDDSGLFAPWFCNVIIVRDNHTGQSQAFPVQRWVKAGVHYKIPAIHTTLPQFDKYPDIRVEELHDKRKAYEYAIRIPGLPVQVAKLPEDENFSEAYQSNIASMKLDLLVTSKLTKFQVRRKWLFMDDIKDLFKSDSFPIPRGMKYYEDDLWFAAQRLVGCNPNRITLCKAIPEKLQVTDEILGPLLDGITLAKALEEKKLFVVDHKIVEGLPVTHKEKGLPAPIALFYLDKKKEFRPIAIQLKQEPEPENPVYLPSDPKNLWMEAKMWFNLADAMIHQSITHLGLTHLLHEGICVATNRNIALNHPVFRLLAPHFLFLLAINFRALAVLISPDGWVQKTMAIGVKGLAVLLDRGLKDYDYDINGCFAEEIKARGLDSPDVLPEYPYRDDGIQVYNAIQNYVSRVLTHYYDSPEKLKNDWEVQAWGKELTAPRPTGVGLKGIPNGGAFETIAELTKTVTSIIFNCSAQHAIHFKQYDEYAFPANYPMTLHGKIPTSKQKVRTSQELVDLLPNKEGTLDTMIITKLISMKATKNLGDWEFQYQHDPPAMEAERLFREELEKISKEVQERNKDRKDIYKYDVLDPAQIPNSISI